jgi:hypothetical protein
MRRARFRTSVLVALAALVVSSLPFVSATAAPVVPVSSNPLGCDPIDPAACLLPFPNDFFTVADPKTDTGRRINFNPAAMPRNGTEITEGGEGKPVDPTEWNRNDGFSPGSMVMTYVPGIDLHKTWGTEDRPHSEVGPNEQGYFDHRDHIADIELYERPDAPMVLINAETGERHPFWSELDSHPDAADERTLILRPAVNFTEGARYVVGLRNLKDTSGATIGTPAAFEKFKAGTATDAARQAHYNTNVFPVLEQAGVAKNDLYLAWDFTVASERNLAERMLHIRDDAFAQLGDTNLADRIVQGDSPEFVVDAVAASSHDWTDSHGQSRSIPVRVVDGRVTVPNYLDRIQQTFAHVGPDPNPKVGENESPVPLDLPAPGSRFLDLPPFDGLPDQNPAESTVSVPFRCRVPLNGQENHTTLYGHGLLGSRDQVGDIKTPQRNGAFMGCGVDWWGMSTADVPTVAAILGDLSNFPSLPDRAQQGFLNFMFLGRAAVHPEGFVTNSAFQQDGKPLVKVADDKDTPLFYDGNSQGGIMGGSLVAVSPDIKRGILGVPAMNYSTLLNRSVDWEPLYGEAYYATYQDPIERQIGFSLIQMLWDRGEANGYAAHMTNDPYPNTPSHDVLLQVAYSDHQVSNHAAEVEARTIGAPIMTPGLPEGRHWEMDPYYTPTAAYPYKGSALVYWDSGNAPPPNGNIPPSEGGDPHSHGRDEPASGWQEAQFLLTGWMVDVCQGGDYLTRRHPANGGAASCKEPSFPPGKRVPNTKTKVEFTQATPSSGDHTDPVTFGARLTDEAGSPLAGEVVTFKLGKRSFRSTTDDSGLAEVSTVLTEPSGTHQLSASTLGNEWYQAASASRPFSVNLEDTITTLDISGAPGTRSLVAHLTDADSGQPVAGRQVRMFIDGALQAKVFTNGNGIATFQVPTKYQQSGFQALARFLGDKYFRASSATTNA